MNMQEKLYQLDSLERLNIELEVDKLVEAKRESAFRNKVQAVLNTPNVKAYDLIELFDKRYMRKP